MISQITTIKHIGQYAEERPYEEKLHNHSKLKANNTFI